MTKEGRFDDLVVYSSIIGSWLVSGWDNEEQLPFEMMVGYGEVRNYCANAYYEGDKKASERYLDSLHYYDFEQEIKNYFVHLMTAKCG